MLHGEFQIPNAEQVWGAPTYVAFVYRSSDAVPLHFSIGNGREDGFRFRSEPPARELNPYDEFGGLVPITEVQPRQTGQIEILLNRYLQFLQSGVYLLHCELDLDLHQEDNHPRNRPQFRTNVKFTLRDDVGARRKALTDLETDLMYPSPNQLRAAAALSELRSAEVVPILGRGLRCPSPAVIEQMLIGLGNTGGEPATKLLREFIKSSPPPLLLRLAKQELARLGG
jgi:hypothetical protein